MTRQFLLFALFATGASAAPMTYTISGVGSGSWNSQPFSEATFTITFNSDTGTIVHGTACCQGADSTPAGTSATVSVSGFAPAALAGDQAVFLNRSEQTAGIWHFNSPDYLTVATPAFADDDLTTTITPTPGTAFSYVTPLPLSTGGTLYFSSVHDATYSQQPGSSGGEVSAVSMTPKDSTPAVNETQTFTAVVADAAGAGDIGGVDFQILDVRGAVPYPCWLYFDARANTLAAYAHGAWGAPVPIGSSGSLLTGNVCTVDTKAVRVSASGNNLSLNLPVTFTANGDGFAWYIYLEAQNKENHGSDYTQVGTVTLPSGPPREEFQISVTPQSKGIPVGGSADYAVKVTANGPLDQPITFSGKAFTSQGYGYTTDQISFRFDPATITGPGTATMHVTSAPGNAGSFQLQVTAQSETYENFAYSSLYVGSTPPAITVSPGSGAGSSATFTLTWRDSSNPTPVANLNFLIAPAVDGRHACWIYWDIDDNGAMYLAGDDGSSWNAVPNDVTANSQCAIDASGVKYFDDPPVAGGNHLGYKSLTIPLSFTPAFAGGKTVFVRATNEAGLSTDYQPLGTWTVQ